MTFTVNSLACDYLHSYTLPIAYTLPSEQAEFAHISEQISSLDDHISQLITLRDALDLRSRQLHNLMSPVHGLPIEVLSYIFQQHINLYRSHDLGQVRWYRQCFAQAFILSSVSSHFRRVALGTSELWKRMTLYMTTKEEIGKASSMLRHCIAIAPSVNICLFEELNGEEARSAVDILFTPDATQKIRALEFWHSAHASNVWMEKLKGSSFPMLGSLKIEQSAMDPNFDLGTLKALTRLHITNQCLNRPIIVPESVQYLDIRYITPHVLASLLYLCPNLVDCNAIIDRQHSNGLDDDTQFTEPLTLNHLKGLDVSIFDVGKTSSFMENLRLPSLETLMLQHFRGYSITVILLCRNVSATLTTLIIKMSSELSGISDSDDLYQLCRIPFPKLRTLDFISTDCKPFMRAIHAQALPDGKSSNLKIRHLPALKSLIFRDSNMEPRSLLDLLKEWKIGDAFCVHIHLYSQHGRYYDCWPPELREELRSIVGNRRIEVTWDVYKVLQLCV